MHGISPLRLRKIHHFLGMESVRLVYIDYKAQEAHGQHTTSGDIRCQQEEKKTTFFRRAMKRSPHAS